MKRLLLNLDPLFVTMVIMSIYLSIVFAYCKLTGFGSITPKYSKGDCVQMQGESWETYPIIKISKVGKSHYLILEPSLSYMIYPSFEEKTVEFKLVETGTKKIECPEGY